MPRFHRKIFYLGAFFALGMMVLMVRLYSMQVVDAEKYQKRTEATRVRNDLFWPARSLIRDRNGKILAQNESVWDVTLDLYKLTDPADILKRAKYSPHAYPELNLVTAFHKEEVLTRLKADYDGPRSARRFFAMWELRAQELCVFDRAVVIDQLARALRDRPQEGGDPEQLTAERHAALMHQFGLVTYEVDGIIEKLGPIEDANPGDIYRAYVQAREALSMPEYWERIRRFPKSLKLEPALEVRAKLNEERAQWIEQLADELDRAADPTSRLIEIIDHTQGRVAELTPLAKVPTHAIDPVAEANLDVIVELVESLNSGESESKEILRDWKKRQAVLNELIQFDDIQGMIDALNAMLEPADIDTIQGSAALDERFNGERGCISLTQDRLKKLRERVIEPYIEDFNERWSEYLRLGPMGEEALLDSNPLLAARRVPRDVIEAIQLNADALPGVGCQPRTNRVYTTSNLTSQLVGGLALPDQEALEDLLMRDNLATGMQEFVDAWFEGDMDAFRDRFRYAVAQHPVGVSGIERAYDERLTGLPGARVIYADASGTTREEKGNWDPITASDLRLTLDTELQAFAVEAAKRWEVKLRELVYERIARQRDRHPDWEFVSPWEAAKADPDLDQVNIVLSATPDAPRIDEWSLRGALVVIDVETGGILAMVNYPTYDADLARSGTEAGREYYQRVVKADEMIPSKYHWLKRTELLNRAVAGQYAPGSTMKIMTSVAMLESGTINTGSQYDEVANIFNEGGVRLRTGHAIGEDVDVVKAIEASSNGFYWHFSLRLPGNNARERYEGTFEPWARAFGFGAKLDSDLFGQASGNLPSGNQISSSELAQNCIGQGKVLATPLQVANLMAIVARKGEIIPPHLAEEADLQRGWIRAKASTWNAVHSGMRKVVLGAGTAHKSQICRRIGVAGKTGTAQTGSFNYEDMDADGNVVKRSLELPDHAWFAGFAPVNKPKVAFAVLGEYSGLFGGDLADLAGEVVEYYLNAEKQREQEEVSR